MESHFIFWKYQPYLWAALTAFLVAFVVTPIVMRLALKFKILDMPSERKVHREPIPLCGGIAIYLGFLIGSIIAIITAKNHPGIISHKTFFHLAGLFICLTLMMLLGVHDDIRGVSARFKFLCQIIISFLLIYFGFSIDFINNPFNGIIFLPKWLVIMLSLFWLVGITNAVNLLDGLDGLLAGVSAISATFFFIVAMIKGQFVVGMLMIALAGASLGFLRYNFNPAKIFMGDTGSLFLGASFAALTIMGALKITAAVALAIPVLIMGIPIIDTTFAIVRRFLRRKPIFQADKGHIHHRLLKLGLSQRWVVIIIYAINLFLGIIGVILAFHIR